jgi:glucokinase
MSCHYLGFESGGTNLRAVLCDESEQCVGRVETTRLASATARDTLMRLAELGQDLRRRFVPKDSAVTAIGWGFGGPVDREKNRPVVNYHEAGWDRVDPAGQLGEVFGVPVFIENDCKLAGLAEAWQGTGVNRGLMVYLTLGSGVGGGLIWNGEIVASGRYGEMEVGHLEVVPGGAICACGKKGCLEAYCSGWGLGERAYETARPHAATSEVARAILECPPLERSRRVFAGWPHDDFARERVAVFLEKLAQVCAQLIQILAPARIVLGGGVAGNAWLADELGKAVAPRLPERFRGVSAFHLGKLGSLAVPLGAAIYAKKQFC